MRGYLPGTIVALAFIALGGCQQKEAADGAAGAAQSSSTKELAAPAGPSGSSPQQRDTLAYEHRVAVELSKEGVSGRLNEIESACRAAVASQCAILESSLRWSASLPSASIRMRLARGGVCLQGADGRSDADRFAGQRACQPGSTDGYRPADDRPHAAARGV